jgi:photosystem II stability/assembly factor-like uncharacterized protein
LARARIAKSSQSRVFVTEGAAGPHQAPRYLRLARALTPEQGYGDVTPVYGPSQSRYDQFVVHDKIQGQRPLPTLGVESLYELGGPALLDLSKRECDLTLSVHLGSCRAPDDHNGGWADGHVMMFSRGKITNWASTELGALDGDQRAPVMETIAATGEKLYPIKPITPTAIQGALVTDEVIDVAICDVVSCGDCGVPSDGAKIQFALVLDSSGSPGLPAKVLYTDDGWATAGSSAISSLGLAESPDAFACMGAYLVVVSEDSGSHHYVKIADLLAGGGIWTEVTGGYVGGGEPKAISVVNGQLAWVVGAGGYIYKLTDPTQAPTVSDAGSATTQDFRAVHAFDDDVVVAVGDANVVVATTNGGDTWVLITGPSIGVGLRSLWVASTNVWLVGNAAANLYYTIDGGTNWSQKTYPASPAAGDVADITFVTEEVGYLASNNSAALSGALYRTIDGGYSWYEVPESGAAFPTNRRLNAIAAPDAEGVENTVLVGGLLDANDGILIKAS